VPLAPSQAAKKAEALRHKAMQRTPTRGHLSAGEGSVGSGLGRLLASAKHKLSLPHGSGDVERAAGSAGGVHMARTTSAEEAQSGF
jgi:hypothetical protein